MGWHDGIDPKDDRESITGQSDNHRVDASITIGARSEIHFTTYFRSSIVAVCTLELGKRLNLSRIVPDVPMGAFGMMHEA